MTGCREELDSKGWLLEVLGGHRKKGGPAPVVSGLEFTTFEVKEELPLVIEVWVVLSVDRLPPCPPLDEGGTNRGWLVDVAGVVDEEAKEVQAVEAAKAVEEGSVTGVVGLVKELVVSRFSAVGVRSTSAVKLSSLVSTVAGRRGAASDGVRGWSGWSERAEREEAGRPASRAGTLVSAHGKGGGEEASDIPALHAGLAASSLSACSLTSSPPPSPRALAVIAGLTCHQLHDDEERG
uniref:Uncharacterized protein n=1 Tax=Oryza sativa subsp. japonica TaxID=39947 RepID=Q6H6P6_ORYSJ|nr:hypothetical protein [Oryza sativa Japonica Group]BAD25603.1 hypothetical protein [Oryza sativa Japonica Group]